MKPFDFKLDSAYVVPALRSVSVTEPPNNNRRKIMIIGGVLLIHGLVVLGLTRVQVQPAEPVELKVTEVTLEQEPSETLIPTPVSQAVSISPVQPTRETVQQPKVTQRVVTQAVNPQVAKPATPSASSAAPPTQTAAFTAKPAASEPVSKPVVSSSVCNMVAFKPRSNTAKYDLEKSVTVVVSAQRTASGRVTAPRVASGSGRADLDAYAVRLASQYTLKSHSDCEGRGIRIPVQFNPS